jgi:hypothetical protein
MSNIVRYDGGNNNGDLSLESLGSVLAKSGYFQDTKDAAQAIVRVLAGRELGIGPIAAMTGVYIVKGRVAIGANLMAAAVKRSGKYNYKVIEHTDAVCRLQFFEAGQPCGESVFTLADAKKAGTQNLDKFPRNMLFARAMSNGVRWYCPDVFDTAVYTPEELRSTSAETAHAASYDAPTAPAGVDTVTGEIVEQEAPSERDAALAAMRAAWKRAKNAGARLETPPAEMVAAMDAADLRMWAATYDEEAEISASQADEADYNTDA